MTLLKITDRAKARLKELVELSEDDVIGIRVVISRGGCSGYKYEIEYAKDLNKLDEKIYVDDVMVLIAPDAVMYLIGSTIDYKETKLKSGFDFNNPNENGRCGCGESFII